MPAPRAAVGNAGDPGQVGHAGRMERVNRDQDEIDLSVVAGTDNGRRFLMRLLEHCEYGAAQLEQSSKIYYNAGRHDVAVEICKWLNELDPKIYIRMLSERVEEQTHG